MIKLCQKKSAVFFVVSPLPWVGKGRLPYLCGPHGGHRRLSVPEKTEQKPRLEMGLKYSKMLKIYKMKHYVDIHLVIQPPLLLSSSLSRSIYVYHIICLHIICRYICMYIIIFEYVYIRLSMCFCNLFSWFFLHFDVSLHISGQIIIIHQPGFP